MIKRSFLLLLLFVTTACAAVVPPDQVPLKDELQTAVLDQVPEVGEPETAVPLEPPTTSPLPVLAPAPDWNNDVWINSDRPLRLVDVQGKVVLLEFWTFGWINCKRVIPWVREWHEKYEGDDFTVISIHYPEFAHEEKYENVLQATLDLGVDYAVALDNEGVTWRAYQQRYWPTRYLIDKQGNIRYKHIGEGAYDETERFIEQLMTESESVTDS